LVLSLKKKKEPVMSLAELEKVSKSTAEENQKSLIQMIKDAVRSTTLTTSQITLIKDTATEVGIANFTDILKMKGPAPKNNLEKFMMLKMQGISDPATVARMITEILAAQDQEQLAAALEVPSAKLQTLLPGPTIKEILTSLTKKFLVAFFISFITSFLFKFFQASSATKILEFCTNAKTASGKKFKVRVAWSEFQTDKQTEQKIQQIVKKQEQAVVEAVQLQKVIDTKNMYSGEKVLDVPSNQIEYNANTGEYRMWVYNDPAKNVPAEITEVDGVVNAKPTTARYLSFGDVEGKAVKDSESNRWFWEGQKGGATRVYQREDGEWVRFEDLSKDEQGKFKRMDFDPSQGGLAIHKKILCGTINWATYSFLGSISRFFVTVAKGFVAELGTTSVLYGFLASAATAILLFGSSTVKGIFKVFSFGKDLVVNGIKSLWNLATKRGKSASIPRRKLALEEAVDPKQVIDETSNTIMGVVGDKVKEVQKFLGSSSLTAMRDLAAKAGMSSFKELSKGEEPVPTNPLEKLIVEKLKRIPSPKERILFLEGIHKASSKEELSSVLEIDPAKLESFFGDETKTIKRTIVISLGIISIAFLLGAFIHVVMTTPILTGAWLTLKSSLMPLVNFLPAASNMTAAEFYKMLAIGAAKSALIQTTIIGIVMYGPSWIRKSLSAIGSWVKQSIIGIWDKIKAPFREASQISPERALLNILGYRGV
jgi:hypothetical protein